jgi:hypothetical protein
VTREIVRNSPEIPVVITTLVSLEEWYGVRTEAINLGGKLQLSSKLWQTTTGMKSALLRVPELREPALFEAALDIVRAAPLFF